MSNKTFKIGLVGCGTISENHIVAISAYDNLKIVALCDVKTEKAIAKNDKHSLSPFWFEKMITNSVRSVKKATPGHISFSKKSLDFMSACAIIMKNLTQGNFSARPCGRS